MLNADFYSNGITFTSAHAMSLIMQNNLAKFGVNYFTFDRTYLDGSHIRLTTHPEWIKYYYQNCLYNSAIYENNHFRFATGYILWQSSPQTKIYQEANKFNIRNGLTISIPKDGYTDFFHFGFAKNHTPENSLKELYEFINKFTSHLADKLIADAHKSRIILNSGYSHNSLTQIQIENKTLHFIVNENLKCNLTPRELTILKHNIQGLSSKEIAIKIGGSYRTIENILVKTRQKFNAPNSSNLIYKVLQLGIDNYWRNNGIVD